MEGAMAMLIEDVASLTFASQDPASLRELLSAGKKIPPDATALLMQDHAEVKAMFLQYQAEKKKRIKSMLAARICTALTVHAQLEEEIFYPEAGRALEDDEQINEAVEEHGTMKEEIAKIVEGMAAEKSVGRYVKKLMQVVEHHVQEEETGMFQDMRQTETDLHSLGSQLAARRAEAFLGMKQSLEEAEAQL
jgi:hypothetical protein